MGLPRIFQRSNGTSSTEDRRKAARAHLEDDIGDMSIADRRELLANLIVLNHIRPDVDLTKLLKAYDFDIDLSADESYVEKQVENMDVSQRVNLTTALILAIKIDDINKRLLSEKGIDVDPVLWDQQDVSLDARRVTLIKRRNLVLGAVGATGAFAFAELSVHYGIQSFDGLTNRLFENEQGVAEGDLSLGNCSFAGDGSKTPYDLGITNRLFELHRARNGEQFGFCGEGMGGSRGNFIAALYPQFPHSIATGQTDAFHIMMSEGGVVDHGGDPVDMSELQELIRPDDENCFESAIIAAANPQLQSLSDVLEAIDAATAETPFKITVPGDMSGSFITAQNILRQCGVLDNPDYDGKYQFIHTSMSNRLNLLESGDADLQISVQFPGEVENEIRSTMAAINEHTGLHFVGITEAEFQEHFSETADYGYHLREIPTKNGRSSAPMLSMGIVLASRDPETITDDYELVRARNRNAYLRSQFAANPHLLDFTEDGPGQFPIRQRPADYVQQASLGFDRRAFFGLSHG